MEVSESNINDLQEKLWYIIKSEDLNINAPTQNLHTNNSNDFVISIYNLKLNLVYDKA